MKVCDICKVIGKPVIGNITLQMRQDVDVRDFCGDCKQNALTIIDEMIEKAKPEVVKPPKPEIKKEPPKLKANKPPKLKKKKGK